VYDLAVNVNYNSPRAYHPKNHTSHYRHRNQHIILEIFPEVKPVPNVKDDLQMDLPWNERSVCQHLGVVFHGLEDHPEKRILGKLFVVNCFLNTSSSQPPVKTFG